MPHLIGFALLIVVGFMVPPLGILMLAIVLLGAD